MRIVDPDFAGMDRVERDNLVWRYLDALPDDVLGELSLLLLLTPDEAKTSHASHEFDHPVPAGL